MLKLASDLILIIHMHFRYRCSISATDLQKSTSGSLIHASAITEPTLGFTQTNASVTHQIPPGAISHYPSSRAYTLCLCQHL